MTLRIDRPRPNPNFILNPIPAPSQTQKRPNTPTSRYSFHSSAAQRLLSEFKGSVGSRSSLPNANQKALSSRVQRPKNQLCPPNQDKALLGNWSNTELLAAAVGLVAATFLIAVSLNNPCSSVVPPSEAVPFLSSEKNFGPKIRYSLTPDPIDVVIPVHPKDADILNQCIQGIRDNVQNLGKIYVVSKEDTVEKQGLSAFAKWISESNYPFSKEDLIQEIYGGDTQKIEKFHQSQSSIGWVYQQFLKLYAPLVIDNISPNTLIVDADTIFRHPTAFMTKEGNPLFNPASEFYLPYFRQAKRLLPELYRVDYNLSGVSHHMLFQKPILDDLFDKIQQQHQMEPWKAMARTINQNLMTPFRSSFSEYEIYFNFARLRTNQALINQHKWSRGDCSADELKIAIAEQFSHTTCDRSAAHREFLPKSQPDLPLDTASDRSTICAASICNS